MGGKIRATSCSPGSGPADRFDSSASTDLFDSRLAIMGVDLLMNRCRPGPALGRPTPRADLGPLVGVLSRLSSSLGSEPRGRAARDGRGGRSIFRPPSAPAAPPGSGQVQNPPEVINAPVLQLLDG